MAVIKAVSSKAGIGQALDYVRKCGMADDMKSDGYASCYDDVSDIIEQLAAKNDIEQLSHYIYSHLCKYRPLKGLLKSVNIKAGRKLKLR